MLTEVETEDIVEDGVALVPHDDEKRHAREVAVADDDGRARTPTPLSAQRVHRILVVARPPHVRAPP